MSNIKALDMLREKIQLDVNNPWSDLKGELLAMCDKVEREVSERFCELPVDADGEPIRVGDTVEYLNGKRDVVRFITVNDNEPTFNEMGWIASKCHHVKPRTLEDVLDDFQAETIQIFGKRAAGDIDSEMLRTEYADSIRAYADEIRELMGVSE